MSKICSIGYVPKYQKDYSELLWYERDMVYIDHLKYKQMKHDPDHYFRNVKVVNFDIINHECCGYKLDGTYKSYKMIKMKILLIIQKMMLRFSCLLLFEIKGMIYGSGVI